MKEAKMHKKVLLLVTLNKFYFKANCPFCVRYGPAKDSSEFLHCLKDFRNIVDKERVREVYRKIYIKNVFPKELLFGANGSFWVQFGPKMTHCCNFG